MSWVPWALLGAGMVVALVVARVSIPSVQDEGLRAEETDMDAADEPFDDGS